jgi:DNA-binding winged helix-turn-helix (wHTH) protein/Flp pilus assembly protein TadD
LPKSCKEFQNAADVSDCSVIAVRPSTAKQPTTVDIYVFGDFRLNLATGCLDRREEDGAYQRVAIGERALEVLGVLVRRAGQVVSKQDIMAAVWPNSAVDGNLTVQISALRRIMDDPRTGQNCIGTVSRRGYRLTVPVIRFPAEREPAVSLSRAAPLPHFTITVLPLVSLSDDSDLHRLARRITDCVTAKLSRIPTMLVVARQEGSNDALQTSKRLSASYSLEGSMWLSRSRIRVNVRLIETQTGRYVWADQFEARLDDTLEAEDEISGRLVRTIDLQLVTAAARRFEPKVPIGQDAGELTTCGWAWFYSPWSPVTLRRARAAFEGALEIDPDCLDAKIGTSLTCIVQVLEGWSNAARFDQLRAEGFLSEAIEHDPNRAMAYHALGMLRRSQTRLSDARAALNRALELDPSDAGAVYQLGLALLYEGEPEPAARHIEKSIRLSPYDPQLSSMHYGLGRCHMFLQDNPTALLYFDRTLATKPKYWDARIWRAGTFGLAGDLARARVEYSEATQLKPEIDSLARWRAYQPWITYPNYKALREETLYVGLRAAGMRDE